MKLRLFLLGGQDLEMLEIKNLLNIIPDSLVLDNQLIWENAELSSYEVALQEYGNKKDVDIYGIELRENTTPIPKNYHRIDHHNDFNTKLSSLEQIAETFYIDLSREQKFIAANDNGYIPAMQKLGATPDEIKRIRFRDKQAQGITMADELNAELSIMNKTIEQGVDVVKTLSNRFSPICDRMFPYQKLLIYTNRELVYYGQNKDNLTTRYQEAIKIGKMYHGGGKYGYIGTVQGVYSEKQILSIKNKIIQLLNPKHHE